MTVEATVDLEGVDDAPETAQEPQQGEQEQQGDPADLGEAGRRALQAERSARAEAERRLREAQDAMTSQAARITELETSSTSLATRAEQAERDGLRYRVALDRGLPADAAHRLVGNTLEELNTDADGLLSLMGARPSRPAPDPSQGGRTPVAQTPEAAFRAAFGKILNP